MHIFRHIFLSNYWWQRSDIWSQALYRYPISWEAFLDPSDSYFLLCNLQVNILIYLFSHSIRSLPSIVAEKNVTKNVHICYTFVQCSTCQTELLCAHGGRFDCKCHIETKGHLLFIYLKVLTNLKQITNPWWNYVAMLLKLVTIYILWDVYVIWMWIDWYRKYQSAEPNIDVSVFMFDLRIINMSSECEYDWYWKISACSMEYEGHVYYP
jgi:hypothetical protein